MNLQEFGQSIKQKYPQYNNVDDTELGKRVLEKYPQYSDRVTIENPNATKGVLDAFVKGAKNIKEDIVKSGQELDETLNTPTSTPAGAFAKLMKTATGLMTGIAKPLIAEPIATGLRAGGEIIQNATGYDINEETANAVNKLVQAGMNTKVAKNTVDAYNKYVASNPESKLAASSLGDIAEMLSYVAGYKGVKATGGALETAGKNAIRTAETGVQKNVAGAREAATNFAEMVKNIGGKGIKKASEGYDNLVEQGTRKVISQFDQDLTKLSRQAIKPTKGMKNITLEKVDDALKTTNEFIFEKGHKPESIVQYRDILRSEKKKFWDEEIASKIKDKASVLVDMEPIAVELEKMAKSKTLQTVGGGEKIAKIAKNLRKKFNMDEAEDLKQFLNKEAEWGEASKNTALKDAYKKASLMIGDAQDAIISKLPGEFSALKKTYGKLAEAYKHIEHRANVIERQAPIGLLEGVSRLEGAGRLARGVFGLKPSEVIAGAGQITLGKSMKYLNDPDFIIKTIFEELSKKKGSGFTESQAAPKLKEMLQRLGKGK